MFSGGLPGGSPGPNAIGTWKSILFIFILSLICGGLFLWVWLIALGEADL